MLDSLLEADRRWSERLRLDHSRGPLTSSAGVLAHSGDSWFWAAGLALIWLLTDPPWRGWALKVFLAIAITAVIVTSMKFAIRRQRPEGEWGALYRGADPHSFPSGHAARVALIVVLVAVWGPDWLFLIVAIWAPLVALARVALGLHYLSDTVVGILIGAAIGWIAVSYF